MILDLSLFCDSCPLGHKWFGTTKYWHQHLFTCFGLCLRSRTLPLVHKTLLYQVTEYQDSRTKPNYSISSRCSNFKVFLILPNPFVYNLQFRHKMTDFLVHRGILNTESLFKERVYWDHSQPYHPPLFTSVVMLKEGGVVDGLQAVTVVPIVCRLGRAVLLLLGL